jgi:hypothetical protein
MTPQPFYKRHKQTLFVNIQYNKTYRASVGDEQGAPEPSVHSRRESTLAGGHKT